MQLCCPQLLHLWTDQEAPRNRLFPIPIHPHFVPYIDYTWVAQMARKLQPLLDPPKLMQLAFSRRLQKFAPMAHLSDRAGRHLIL